MLAGTGAVGIVASEQASDAPTSAIPNAREVMVRNDMYASKQV
jgi:hypothetical protein